MHGMYPDVPSTALAAEGKEVQLVAERKLAVSADSFHVANRHAGIALLFPVLRRRWIRHVEDMSRKLYTVAQYSEGVSAGRGSGCDASA